MTDASTGTALSGVQVEARRDGQTVASATTDSSGAYSLKAARGACQIAFSRNGYKSQIKDSELKGPIGENQLDVLLTAGISDKPDSTIIANGQCGKDLTWMLDDKGTLTIYGIGEMYYYYYYYGNQWAPWYLVQPTRNHSDCSDSGFRHLPWLVCILWLQQSEGNAHTRLRYLH